MRLRLFEHAWPQWIVKIASHPVVPVAVVFAVSALAIWALIDTELRMIYSPRTPLIFSPK